MALEKITSQRQQVDGKEYEWDIYSVEPPQEDETPSVTDEINPSQKVIVAEMKDPHTGFKLLRRSTNPNVRTEALDAWAMTNHSRNPGSTLEIISDIYEQGVDVDEKMGEVFNEYGHASVADQSQISVDFNDVPMHVPLSLFNYGELNSGQEKSTRYQEEFGENTLHDIKHYLPADINPEQLAGLNNAYQELGAKSLELFELNKNRVQDVFEKKYQPTEKQQRSLVSRVLDTARSHLLLGQGTGFGFKTNARDWARVVGTFRASEIPAYQQLGDQIHAFLSPTRDFEEQIGIKTESPQLIRHANANNRVVENVNTLRNYLQNNTTFRTDVNQNPTFDEKQLEVTLIDKKYDSATRMAMQYALRAFPGADGFEALEWLNNADDQVKRDISGIIFAEHNHHYSISQKGRTTDIGARMTGSLAEARDWNRHRAWGRFLPQVPTIESPAINREDMQRIVDEGYVLTIYLQNPLFSEAKAHMKEGLQEQYDGLNRVLDQAHNEFGDDIDYSFALNVLPLGHKTDIWMHGDPRQSLYMTKLRVRGGGHINYRQQAWDLNQQIADSSPFLEAIRAQPDEKPDAMSREQFFNRK